MNISEALCLCVPVMLSGRVKELICLSGNDKSVWTGRYTSDIDSNLCGLVHPCILGMSQFFIKGVFDSCFILFFYSILNINYCMQTV